jgi:aminopeptidase N
MNKNFFVTSSRTNIQLPLRRTLQRSVQNCPVIPTIGGICSSFVQKLGRCLLRRHDMQLSFAVLILLLFSTKQTNAQLLKNKPAFTHADTLRGSLNENRDWWDVLRYDITVKPDFEKKEIEGKVIMQAIATKRGKLLQLDLQQPLIIDSIIRKGNYFRADGKGSYPPINQPYIFFQEGNIVMIQLDEYKSKGERIDFHIYYHGKPIEAKTPPWDGGWIWKKDKNGNPWMSVAVQGLGASAWYPCKDYQGDEPDNGASLTMIVPDSLKAIANGKLRADIQITNSKFRSYSWEVKNPINNYCIIPYIGKYVNFTDTLMGEKGKLDLSYWVLDYNLEKAKEQFKQVKPMLRAFEYWFGPYPFYEDSYKLIDAPHLGMEHQSAVAYGNQYKNGYLGMDRSNSGWGKKWDFIIIHESGHEWFANNITTKDIADMWVHESFTTYSETLFTEYYYGIQAGNEYNYGQRRNIRNDEPIIGPYGVNKEDSGDMYDKGSNMIHSIRHAMNDDKKFRAILRGLNKTFWHKTVTTKEVEDFISNQASFNFQKVFDQYLRTIQIPVLEYYFSKEGKRFHFRYSNCITGFNLPLVFSTENNALQIQPTETWKSIPLEEEEQKFAVPQNLEKLFYIKTKQVTATE